MRLQRYRKRSIAAGNVPLLETLAFVKSFLRPKLHSILEVGCGGGEVASALQAAGYQVVAIDEDEDAVTEAHSRGVNATRVRWLEFKPAPFDVVLFTRSLHHLGSAEVAIQHAVTCLPSHGMVLVEDFAFGECPRQLIHWFSQELNGMTRLGLVLPASTLVHALATSADPATTWENEHGSDIASGEEMEMAVRRHFMSVETFDAPYLYRYLWSALEERPEDASYVEQMKAGEINFTRQNGLRPLGRRFVGQYPK